MFEALQVRPGVYSTAYGEASEWCDAHYRQARRAELIMQDYLVIKDRVSIINNTKVFKGGVQSISFRPAIAGGEDIQLYIFGPGDSENVVTHLLGPLHRGLGIKWEFSASTESQAFHYSGTTQRGTRIQVAVWDAEGCYWERRELPPRKTPIPDPSPDIEYRLICSDERGRPV